MRNLLPLLAFLLFLPLTALDAAETPSLPLAGGEILSVDDGGVFVYMEVLFPGDLRLWVMGPLCRARVGDTVDLLEGTYHDHFVSEALNREFDRIVVATKISLNGQTFRAFSAHHPPPGCAPENRDTREPRE